jgi:3'-phosphoadenosine 5'-phosphosulfate sulfotransferase (PAPS reductase)/FAD synthetase
MRYGGREINQVRSQIWVNPIYWWSVSDRDRYIAEHELPINPISELLGMSGECLCGAFAHPGEKELIRLVDPKTARRIDQLESDVLDCGFPWSWEGGPPSGGLDRSQMELFMPMCVGCEK